MRIHPPLRHPAGVDEAVGAGDILIMAGGSWPRRAGEDGQVVVCSQLQLLF